MFGRTLRSLQALKSFICLTNAPHYEFVLLLGGAPRYAEVLLNVRAIIDLTRIWFSIIGSAYAVNPCCLSRCCSLHRHFLFAVVWIASWQKSQLCSVSAPPWQYQFNQIRPQAPPPRPPVITNFTKFAASVNRLVSQNLDTDPGLFLIHVLFAWLGSPSPF